MLNWLIISRERYLQVTLYSIALQHLDVVAVIDADNSIDLVQCRLDEASVLTQLQQLFDTSPKPVQKKNSAADILL